MLFDYSLRLCLVLRKSGGKKVERKKNGKEKKWEESDFLSLVWIREKYKEKK